MSNIKIKLDMSSKEQLTAASNFFKELADIATPQKLEDIKVVSEEVPGKPLASKTTKEPTKDSETTKSTPTSKAGSRKSPKSKTSTESGPEKEPSGSSQEAEDSSKPTKSSAKASQKQDEPSKTETPKDLREPLRVLLNQKVDDHRKTIKDELGKYNAKSISNLDVEHHPAFMEFMENLS